MSRTYRNRKLRGFTTDDLRFGKASRGHDHDEPGKDPRIEDEHWSRPADDPDPRAHVVKPKNKVWDHVPYDSDERAVYEGLHLHSAENPFGLHKHLMDADEPLGGGHTHGPSNAFGTHTHKGMPTDNQMFSTSGHHVHNNENYPSGKHVHAPEDFSSKIS